MIELKKQFTKNGVKCTQIFKDDELAIYQISQRHADDNDYSIWYEVFKRMVKAADIYHADEFEKYPYDEAFGKWAWSCSNVGAVNKVLKRQFPNHQLAKEGFQAI